MKKLLSVALGILTAEISGVALALQLVSSVSYLLWVPFAGFAVWLVIWRVRFAWQASVGRVAISWGRG